MTSRDLLKAAGELKSVLSAGKRFQTFFTLSLTKNADLMQQLLNVYIVYTHDVLWNLHTNKKKIIFVHTCKSEHNLMTPKSSRNAACAVLSFRNSET